MAEEERIDTKPDELNDQELDQAAGAGNAPGAYDDAGSRGSTAAKRSGKRARKSGGMRRQAGDATGGHIE